MSRPSIDALRAEAAKLDAHDPLAGFRDRFVIDDPELIYLDGNSLGRAPIGASERIERLVRDEWGSRLVRGWGEGWLDLPRRLGAKIANLIGAKPQEVVVCDSTSVNLYKLCGAALEAVPEGVIVSEEGNFPSDLYVLQGLAHAHSRELRLAQSPAELDFSGAALVSLSHTSFKSGRIHDMAAINRAARSAGALVVWDLSHSVGAVPVDLEGSGADMAVGCTYKHLHGGPGSPAFLYVRENLCERLSSPIKGWFGQRDAFHFDLRYSPRNGIEKFMAGTPPIVSMAAVEPGVDLVLEAGIATIREKSMAQTELLVQLWEDRLRSHGFSLNSPSNSGERGSHVAFGHPHAYRIDQALIAQKKVIPDFRAPDIIRLGVSPLYTTYIELVEAVDRIVEVMESRAYELFPGEFGSVT